MNKNLIRGLVAAGVVTATASAHAAVDTTEVMTFITDAATAIAAVGAAVLTLHFGAKVWKWIKGAS